MALSVYTHYPGNMLACGLLCCMCTWVLTGYEVSGSFFFFFFLVVLHGFVCIARIQSSSFEPDPTVSRAMSTDVCNCIPRTSVGQHVSVRMRVGSERAHSTRGAGKCASRRGVRRSPGRDKGGDKALARAGASRRGEPEPEPARRWSAGSHSGPEAAPREAPAPLFSPPSRRVFLCISSSVPVLCASPALSRPLFVWLGLCLDRLFSSVFLSIPCPSPASPPQFSVFQCLRVLLFFYLFLYVSLRVSLLLIFFFLCALLLTLFLYSLSPSLSLSDCLLIDECLQASASSPGPLSHRHAVAQH